MSNFNLVTALRNSLNGIMEHEDIDKAIAGELKEGDVEADYPESVERMSPPVNNIRFTNVFNGQIADNGGVWLGRVWDLRGYELEGPLRSVATEECSAITNFGPTDRFDAGKALTNILRMIKAGSLKP